MTYASEAQLREEMLRISALTYERHLLVALDGNLSVRLSDELILCTQAGCHKAFSAMIGSWSSTSMGRRCVVAASRRQDGHASRLLPDDRIFRRSFAHPPTCIAFTVAF